MTENVEIMEKGILEKLPQIPFIVDQVGYAMKWAKEVYDEGAYYKNIEFTLDVAEYATKISQPNFYKTYLIIGALLMDIPGAINDTKFEMFKSTSNSVENILNNIIMDPKTNEEYGCFKSVSLHIAKLARTNQEYLAVFLLGILSDLKEIVKGMEDVKVKAPITTEDFIKVLGYAFVMQNLRGANLNLLNEVREILNKIDIILNSLNF